VSLLDVVRSWYWRTRLRVGGARVGRRLRVGGRIDLLLRDGASLRNVRIGDDVTLGGATYIRLRRNGRLTIGDRVRTGVEVWLVGANDAELSVGANTALGSYCIFNGGHGLRIGADCLFAAFVYVNSSEHRFERGEPIRLQGFDGAEVRIGDDVWIGGHVSVNKGVTIGTGAVIGAGAVVTKDVDEYTVAAGSPARAIRKRE
jgi:acetyltransferase-like isoleucine patch superfamily enzyme